MTAAPHPAALSHDDLVRLTGYQRPADIERWCEQNGVRYFRGRRGIWTTLDAVNAALGVRDGKAEPARLHF
jgi:hypothetical protein